MPSASLLLTQAAAPATPAPGFSGPRRPVRCPARGSEEPPETRGPFPGTRVRTATGVPPAADAGLSASVPDTCATCAACAGHP